MSITSVRRRRSRPGRRPPCSRAAISKPAALLGVDPRAVRYRHELARWCRELPGPTRGGLIRLARAIRGSATFRGAARAARHGTPASTCCSRIARRLVRIEPCGGRASPATRRLRPRESFPLDTPSPKVVRVPARTLVDAPGADFAALALLADREPAVDGDLPDTGLRPNGNVRCRRHSSCTAATGPAAPRSSRSVTTTASPSRSTASAKTGRRPGSRPGGWHRANGRPGTRPPVHNSD